MTWRMAQEFSHGQTHSPSMIFEMQSSINIYYFPIPQYFRREEANFVTMNDIDVMALLMPTGAGRRALPQDSGGGGGSGGSGGGGGGGSGGGGGGAKAKKKARNSMSQN